MKNKLSTFLIISFLTFSLNDVYGQSVQSIQSMNKKGDFDTNTPAGSELSTTDIANEIKLIAPNGEAEDRYAFSVAIDGEYAVVGAHGTNGIDTGDPIAHHDNGAVYIYKYNGAGWELNQRIASPVSNDAYHFGKSVAISGNKIIIGAVSGASYGAAYIYTKDGTSWVQEAVLIPSDAARFRSYGYKVAIHGNRAIVGAFWHGEYKDEPGRAYIFAWDGTGWKEEAILIPSDGKASDSFGGSVAIYGSHAIVGANGHDHGMMYNTGAAYTYLLQDGVWVEKSKLINSDNMGYEGFGRSVSISGNRALIGKYGAAYIFGWNGEEWLEEAKLEASDGQENDRFGSEVALSGDRAVIGRIDAKKDAAYLFYIDENSWQEQMKLYASDRIDNDQFGYAASMSGDRAIIGAYGHSNSDETRNYMGAAYIYTFPPLDTRKIVVNSIADRAGLENNTNCDTGEMIEIDGEMVPECTLRAAIEALNNRNRSDSITFNIEGENAHIINLGSPLPVPEHPVVIDASTQPGYNGLPLITLNGLENIENGFVLEHGESVVRGLSIGGFTNAGILITGGAENIIEANHIGVNAAGTTAFPNRSGIIIENSSDNLIGGPDPAQRNIISGNTDSRPDIKMEVERTGSGVLIEGVSAINNHIQGNYIGTDFTGMQAVGNGFAGIYLYNAPQNLIGGNEDVSGNLISANGSVNITIRGKEASGNIVAGNIIGANANGTAALSENSTGVRITFGSNNKIGGITAIPGTAPGNLISGNSKAGVVIVGVIPEAANPESAEVAGIASGNVIAGNLIGTNKDGTSALSNNTGIVVALDAPKTQIGGSDAGSRNIISGNLEAGVILADTTGGFSPHESSIAGNYIGTTISGNQPLGNGGPGLLLITLSANPNETTGIAGVTIGGTTTASQNIIAGNKSLQIEVFGPVSAGTVIMNNYIGVLQNGQSGQSPEESEYGILVRTDGAYIGEDMEGNTGPNVIGGNQNGIFLVGNMNLVSGGNKIGTNPGGTVAVPNYTGIWVLGDGNSITGNTISGNRNYGIMIGQERGSPAYEGILFEPESTIIARNMIGTNSQGKNAIGNGLGENGAGVMIGRGINSHLYFNTISGNHHGVHNDNSPFENTFLAGNIIGAGGIDPIDIENGLVLPEFTPIPNQGDGVHITDGKVYLNDEPTVEPFSELELGNYIQNNLGAGIRRTGRNLSTDFEILSNFFFNNTGLAIDFEPEGVGGGNTLHEPPVMMQPVIEEETARIRGISAVKGKIQLYATPFCHPSGNGEGRLYLSGQDQIISAGEAFSAEISLPENLRVGYYITALVTHNSRTSEFCKCMRIADKEKYQEQLLEELAREALELGRLTIESNETKSLAITGNKNSLQEIEAFVYASEFNLPPDHSYFEGSALAPDGSEITPNKIDTTLYWSVGAVNVPDLVYDVCVDASGTEFQENQRMVLVQRNGIGSHWKPLDTSVDDNNVLCASGLTAFGDIAIATYDASIPTTIALFENQKESTKPFTLLQNYPNPFASNTKIPFEIAKTGKVEVLIIDNLGRTIKRLINETLPAGKHEAAFEGASLPEGMYFYQIRGNGFLETRKMVKTTRIF